MGTRARASANPGRDGLKATATGVLVGLVLGPIVGVLWLWIAPTPTAINTGGLIYLKDQNTSEFIAADGWFLIIGLVVGALSGAALFWLFRRRPNFAIVGLTLGALAGAWIAWKVGAHLGPEPLEKTASNVPDGGTVSAPINLRAKVALLGWPLGGVIAFVSLFAGLEKPPAAPPVPVGAGSPYAQVPQPYAEETPAAGLATPPVPPPPRRAAPIRPITRPGRGQPLGPPPGAAGARGTNGAAAGGADPDADGPHPNGPAGNGRGPSVRADGRPGEFGTGQGR